MTKQKEKSGIVYEWYFPKSRRLHPYYIGESYNGNPMSRARGHMHPDSKLNKLLAPEGLTVEKDGVLIIRHANIDDQYSTWELEKEEIRIHNCIWPNGFNMTAGGDGMIACAATRKKISEAMKGKQNLLGFHPSAATRKKMSDSLKGNQRRLGFHPSAATRKKISEAMKNPSAATRKKVSENNGMRRPEVVEKQAASRMGLTVPQYRRQKRRRILAEIKRLAAKATSSKSKPILNTAEHRKMMGARER